MWSGQRGLSLRGMKKEKQNENDLILSRETPSHWVVIVVLLLGEKRAALLFFNFLSYEVTAAEQLKSRSTLVAQVKEAASEL